MPNEPIEPIEFLTPADSFPPPESAGTAGTTAESFTAWDRRVIAAIGVVGAAKKGAIILRIVGVVVALAATIGYWLATFANTSNGLDTTPGRVKWGELLAGDAPSLAFAGVVIALSYLLEVAAARLDIDIVLADEDESPTDA